MDVVTGWERRAKQQPSFCFVCLARSLQGGGEEEEARVTSFISTEHVSVSVGVLASKRGVAVVQFKASVCISAHVCARNFGPQDSEKRGFHFPSFFFFFSGTLSAKPIHTFSRGRTLNLDRLWGRALSWKRRTEFVFVPSKWGKSSTSRAGELRLLLFFVQICKVAPRENRWVNSKRRVAVFKRRKPQPEGIFICAGLLWGGPRCDFTTRCCLFEQVWVNP